MGWGGWDTRGGSDLGAELMKLWVLEHRDLFARGLLFSSCSVQLNLTMEVREGHPTSLLAGRERGSELAGLLSSFLGPLVS